MRTARDVLVLALVLAMAAPLMAQREGRRREGKKPRPEKKEPRPFMFQGLLKEIELTAEQKAKLEQLKKEMGPKLMEARKKMQGIFTQEQRKARAEAQKAAKAAGKKGREIRAALEAAVKLTEEQKAKLAAAKKAAGELQKQVREKIMALLTPEQKEAIKERMKKLRQEGKKRGEKKAGKRKKTAAP